MLIDERACECGIRDGLALQRAFTRAQNAFAHDVARFTRWSTHQLGDWQTGHFHMHVDAIQQGPGQAGSVAGHILGRATTARGGMAQMATGAGVHGGDKLKGRRELRLRCRSLDGHPPGFKRLAKRFQRCPLKFTEFVQKQLIAQRSRGASVLFISNELEELIAVSDRIIVLHRGEITGTADPQKVDPESLGLMMMGQKEGAS
jgi:hypothetical protein